MHRFLHRFPAGFSDDGFERLENSYKRDAQRLFEKTLGSEARRLVEAGDARELVRRALRVLSHRERGHKHSLLPNRHEIISLSDALDDDAGALEFFEALFAFIDSPGVSPGAFDRLVRALYGLPQRGAVRVANWPNLTVFPFFADPSRFMFLKPDATQKAASSFEFELNYDSGLNWLTYKQLLSFSDMLLQRLCQLGARDLMDVQSFIWVVWSPSCEMAS